MNNLWRADPLGLNWENHPDFADYVLLIASKFSILVGALDADVVIIVSFYCAFFDKALLAHAVGVGFYQSVIIEKLIGRLEAVSIFGAYILSLVKALDFFECREVLIELAGSDSVLGCLEASFLDWVFKA